MTNATVGPTEIVSNPNWSQIVPILSMAAISLIAHLEPKVGGAIFGTFTVTGIRSLFDKIIVTARDRTCRTATVLNRELGFKGF